jgi:hypothetical protein
MIDIIKRNAFNTYVATGSISVAQQKTMATTPVQLIAANSSYVVPVLIIFNLQRISIQRTISVYFAGKDPINILGLQGSENGIFAFPIENNNLSTLGTGNIGKNQPLFINADVDDPSLTGAQMTYKIYYLLEPVL